MKKALSNNKPIKLVSKVNKLAVVLFHGYSTMPVQFKELADFLYSRGINCYIPLLPGHGTKAEDLLNVDDKKLIAYCNKYTFDIAKKEKKIFIGGVSAGANLAVIAADYVEGKGIIPAGIVAIAPMNKFRFNFVLWILSFIKMNSKSFRSKISQTPNHKHDLENGITYKKLPYKALREMFRIISLTKKSLYKFDLPILVLQAQEDYFFRKDSSYLFFREIPGKRKKLVYSGGREHVPLRDKYKNLIFNAIYEFIVETG